MGGWDTGCILRDKLGIRLSGKTGIVLFGCSLEFALSNGDPSFFLQFKGTFD